MTRTDGSPTGSHETSAGVRHSVAGSAGELTRSTTPSKICGVGGRAGGLVGEGLVRVCVDVRVCARVRRFACVRVWGVGRVAARV